MVRKPEAGSPTPLRNPPSLDKRRGVSSLGRCHRLPNWPLLTHTDSAMPLPIITNVVRATYRGALGSGTQWANVMHFRWLGGGGGPFAGDIASMDAIVRRLYTGTAFTGGAAWLTFCRSAVSLIDATVYILNGTSVPQLININAQGTNATGTMLPQEVAPVLTLRTAKRGRSYRGRVYLPAPVTTQVDATGNLVGACTTATIAQAIGVYGALGAANWEWVVASYLHATSEPLASITMDSRPDVQRRRKR